MSQKEQTTTDLETDLATPTEVLEALEEEFGDEDENEESERRGHQRFKWNVAMTLQVVEEHGDKVIQREIEITTLDISTRGFGFEYHQFLYPETRVHVRFDSLANQPVLRGAVQNCIFVGGRTHRIGVRFETSK